VYYRADGTNIQKLRASIQGGVSGSLISPGYERYVDEDILAYIVPRTFGMIDGATGIVTPVVQFLGDESFPGTPATDGRSVIVERPDGWYLCGIPETPGLSEQLDFVIKEDVEYIGTYNEPPIAYGGYILWKSRIYDTATGEGRALWPEYDIDSPDGRHVLLGDSLFGSRSDPYPLLSSTDVEQTFFYDVPLPSGPPELVSALPYGFIPHGSHEPTNAIITSGVAIPPVGPPGPLILSIDATIGTPTVLAQLEASGADAFRGPPTVVGDDLYFVRYASPGCLVRLPLVP